MLDVRIESPCAAIAVVHLSGARLASDAYAALVAARSEAVALGAKALLIDLSGARRVLASGLGALVELASCGAGPDLVLCGASEETAQLLRSLGLDRAFPLFADRTAAQASPAMMRHRLSGMRAVILAAGTGPVIADMPTAMLDFLGKPVLRHILDQVNRSGIGAAIVATGQHSPMIAPAFRDGRIGGLNVFLSNGGEHRTTGRVGTHGGSATALGRLLTEGNLTGDTLVMGADNLTDIDIASLHAAHCAAGADLTIAAARVGTDEADRHNLILATGNGRVMAFQHMPARERARSTLADTGIYIFGPRALALVGSFKGRDIAADLLPSALAAGLRVQVFDQPFQWVRIGSLQDWFRALSLGLSGGMNGIGPAALQVRGGLWLGPDAVVAPGCVIHGPCFIGQGARVGDGVEILGPSVICAGAVVEGPSLIRSSIVMPGACIRPGTTVDHAITDGVLTISHADVGRENPDSPPRQITHAQSGALHTEKVH